MSCFCVVIASWLNASMRNQVGVGMTRSARGWIVKGFDRSYRLDTNYIKTYRSFHFCL